MKILLMGSNGMLGKAICRELQMCKEIKLICAARQAADYCLDFREDARVWDCIRSTRPDAVINAAAIVSLDRCENETLEAYRINARLCSILSELCRETGSYYVQVSTDHYYVDGGRKKHDERFPVTLLNEYARTKFAGECFALAYEQCVVLRTNIVGFRSDMSRPTFLEWAIGTIQEDKPLTLYGDYFTSPLHTRQFARILKDIILHRPTGIYNLASSTVSSKREFVLRLAQAIFHRVPTYQEGSVKQQAYCRRANSLGLDTAKLERLLGYRMPDLSEVIQSIVEEYGSTRTGVIT